LFTFRIGLWNIGVEGQIMMGAVFTTAALRWGVGASMPTPVTGFSFVAGIAEEPYGRWWPDI
jgi:simple sugar transport system permease protein